MNINLHDYQEIAMNFALEKKRAILALEMGLGKTLTSLVLIDKIKQQHPHYKTLIIGPKEVVENVWEQEGKKWGFKHSIGILKGTRDNKLSTLDKQPDVTVISTGSLELISGDFFQKDSAYKYDVIIVDEASLFKNPKSKRARALGRLTGNEWFKTNPEQYVIGLTGSLGSEGEKDAEDVAQAIAPWNVSPWMFLLNNVIAMKATDWLEMPELIHQTVIVNMPNKAHAIHDTLQRQLVAELERNKWVASVNHMVNVGRLLQITGGALYNNARTKWDSQGGRVVCDDDGGYTVLHDAKIKALGEFAKKHKTLLVFYSFKHELERLKEAFPYAVSIKDKGAKEDWNNGKIRMLFANPKSAGHGLNLQHGGNIIVWYTLPRTWSYDEYSQANARLYRQGQKEKEVYIIHIATQGTVEERLVERLQGKADTQENIIRDVLVKPSTRRK